MQQHYVIGNMFVMEELHPSSAENPVEQLRKGTRVLLEKAGRHLDLIQFGSHSGVGAHPAEGALFQPVNSDLLFLRIRNH